MVPTTTAHIYLDDQGRAWVDQSNVKVIEIALDKISGGMSPEQMHEEFPDLSLAQIHAALSYYYDHKAEFDAQIEKDTRYVEEMMAQAANSPARQRVQRLKGTSS